MHTTRVNLQFEIAVRRLPVVPVGEEDEGLITENRCQTG
jgi:hypothetical protein